MNGGEKRIRGLMDFFGDILQDDIPSAYQIHALGKKYLDKGDSDNAKKCQRLNYLLHNSHIPTELEMGDGVRFGYGGIGLVIHPSCKIGRGVVVGQGVTLGGRAGGAKIDEDGNRINLPIIGDYSYIAAGAKVLGGVKIGPLSIVGANAVVIKDVPPLCIVSGVPSKVNSRITLENALKYKKTFTALRSISNEEYLALVERYIDC